MPAPSPLPDGLLRAPFRVSEAARVGVSRHVLEGQRFRAPFSGTRIAASEPDTLVSRCRAVLLLHPDAAVLLRSGVRAVRADVTWGDLADRLGLENLVVLGDAMLVRGLATLEALTRIALGARHRRGVRLLCWALPLLEPRTDSPRETRLRLLIVGAGLPRPLANRDVVVDGEWIARPDLSYPHLGIAIEYDGDGHRTTRRWRSDRARRQLLEDAGWLVLQFTADDLERRPDLTIARIRRAIASRGGGSRGVDPVGGATWRDDATPARGGEPVPGSRPLAERRTGQSEWRPW